MKFTRSAVVKNRANNSVVAKFVNPDHAKLYCEQLNKSANKKQFHWFETNESL